MSADRALIYLRVLPVILVSLTIHEYAHAWVAYRYGDDTAKSMGRLTLNPLAHISLFGTIILPLLLYFSRIPPFGWAKPIPVNFSILTKKQYTAGSYFNRGFPPLWSGQVTTPGRFCIVGHST